MINAHADHVNWMLVVILVTLALLLALVSSTGGFAQVAVSVAPATTDESRGLLVERSAVSVQAGSHQESRFSEVCYLARELYQAGKLAEARNAFEDAVAARPIDSGARAWAGIAAYREGDHAAAVSHWNRVALSAGKNSDSSVWAAIAQSASYLETDDLKNAARILVPLERKEEDISASRGVHPVATFYAGLLYEKLALAAPDYRDAVEESLGERFSSPMASAGEGVSASPNSRAWLQFLAKRCFQRTVRQARVSEWWTVPVVPWQATLDPSLAPTVEDLLDALGSADFAYQAAQKLRALRIYESEPDRGIEIFDPQGLFRAGKIARLSSKTDCLS